MSSETQMNLCICTKILGIIMNTHKWKQHLNFITNVGYWTVPKHGTVQDVGYIKEGAPRKVTDTQSGSRNCQPMIVITGTYLRDCTVQCRSQSVRELSREPHDQPVVAVVWYWQVVQHLPAINISSVVHQSFFLNRRKTVTEITRITYTTAHHKQLLQYSDCSF